MDQESFVAITLHWGNVQYFVLDAIGQGSSFTVTEVDGDDPIVGEFVDGDAPDEIYVVPVATTPGSDIANAIFVGQTSVTHLPVDPEDTDTILAALEEHLTCSI